MKEDLIVLTSLAEIGPKWSKISMRLVGRPENMVKNRYYAVIKKKIQSKFLNKAVKSKSEIMIESLLKDKIKYNSDKVVKNSNEIPKNSS